MVQDTGDGRGGKLVEPVLELVAASKSFGSVRALASLSFALPKSRILAVVGPNGAGKTTLIRLLAGFIRTSSGSVRLLGHDPWFDRRVMNEVGVVPDRVRFPPFREVGTFIDASCRLRGVPEAWGVQELKTWGLDGFRRREIRTLSTGLFQRLMLAQALLHRPQLLIADEPAANLDTFGRHQLLQMLHDRCIRTGLTVVISSHILEDLQALSTDYALLANGHLVRSGLLQELDAGSQHPRFRVTCSNPDRLLEELSRLEPNLTASIEGGRLLLSLPLANMGLWSLVEKAAGLSGVVVTAIERESALLETLLGQPGVSA